MSEQSLDPRDVFPDSFAELLGRAVKTCLYLDSVREAADAAAKQFVKNPVFEGRTRLIIVGSGDSLFSARSAVQALRRWTGFDVETRTSIEFARYDAPLLTERDVLVAVSNSGSSSRTREGITMAKARSVPTVGITGSETGPLAQAADVILVRRTDPFNEPHEEIRRGFLHMAEFVTAYYAVMSFGVALGVQRGVLSAEEGGAWHERMRRAIESIGPTAEALEPQVVEFLADYPDLDTVWVLGAGPCRGCAEYSAAKFHEQVPLNGIPQDLEEWAHLQYFLTREWKKRAPIIVLAPEGNALDRAEELLIGIRESGGTALAVTNSADALSNADRVMRIPSPTEELITPFTFHLPCQLMTMHLAKARGVLPTPLRRSDDFWLIRGGATRANADGLK